MTARPLNDHSRLSINDATTKRQWTLAQAIEGYAAQGVHGISVWRDKLAECGVKEAARMLADHGMTVTGLCRGGMFPAPTAAERRAAIDDNRRAIEEAAAIGAQCLVLVVGGLPKGSKDIAGARSMVLDGLYDIVEEARAARMPLAIEPLHPMYAADRACVNTMAQANDLCDRLGAGVGIAVDVYHVWWDPDLEREIRRAGKERILAFHICDWLVPTTDLLLDRGMMGDGVIDIPRIRGWVEAAGYDGHHEVEIFSAENWWKRDPAEVVATCKERYLTAV
ncbi:MAG TPA: sugar phosphate isomerase/epimerase family protein [Alphaproteobacteria bacterium]|nr:sugar phosphate isomerase/epimerase family protein [Alphaproteobacteria bacterium]